jgi:hypothetical protein
MLMTRRTVIQLDGGAVVPRACPHRRSAEVAVCLVTDSERWGGLRAWCQYDLGEFVFTMTRLQEHEDRIGEVAGLNHGDQPQGYWRFLCFVLPYDQPNRGLGLNSQVPHPIPPLTLNSQSSSH